MQSHALALVSFFLLPAVVSAAFLKGLRTVTGSELAAEDCTCLPWQQTYASRVVSCGDALEFPSISQWFHADHGHLTDVNANFPATVEEWMKSPEKPAGWEPLHGEYCDGMFHRIRGNACVKVASDNDATQWFGRSWCYVSDKCQNLNGGVRVEGKPVSAKFCDEAEDEVLSEKTPQELEAWYYQQGLVPMLGLVVKMAYPYMGENFADIIHYRSNTTALQNERTGALGARLAALNDVISKGKPVVYDLGDHATTKFVVHGKALWKFDDPPTCLDGCPPGARTEADQAIQDAPFEFQHLDGLMANWMPYCKLPRGCESGLETVRKLENVMSSNSTQYKVDGYKGLLKMPNTLMEWFHLHGNFGPYPGTFHAMWESFDRNADDELTPSLAAKGEAKKLFGGMTKDSLPEMRNFLFEVADTDGSGGISKAELRDIIHVAWELHENADTDVDYNPMYCWIGLWKGATYSPPGCSD